MPSAEPDQLEHLSKLANFARTIEVGMKLFTLQLGVANQPQPTCWEYSAPFGDYLLGQRKLGMIPPKSIIGPIKDIQIVHDLPYQDTFEPGIAVRSRPYSTYANSDKGHTGDVWIIISRGKKAYATIDPRFHSRTPLIKDDRIVLSQE